MWIVRSNRALEKRLKRLRSNAVLFKAYKGVVDRLSEAEDPARLGRRLHGMHAPLCGCRLPGNMPPSAQRRPGRHRVILANVGYRKELFGRDNR